jgi:hypothetical protein
LVQWRCDFCLIRLVLITRAILGFTFFCVSQLLLFADVWALAISMWCFIEGREPWTENDVNYFYGDTSQMGAMQPEWRRSLPRPLLSLFEGLPSRLMQDLPDEWGNVRKGPGRCMLTVDPRQRLLAREVTLAMPRCLASCAFRDDNDPNSNSDLWVSHFGVQPRAPLDKVLELFAPTSKGLLRAVCEVWCSCSVRGCLLRH